MSARRPWLNTAAFLLLSGSLVFLLLLLSFERRSGNHPPPPGPVSSAGPSHIKAGALMFTSAAGNTEAAVGVLTGMSVPTEPSCDLLVVNRSAGTHQPPARSAAPRKG